MPESLTARRGRKPSIGTATERVRNLRRTLKALVTEASSLETRLDGLDRYYTRMAAERPKVMMGKQRKSSTLRGQGPNVRDVAHEILSKLKKPLPIVQLAQRVRSAKKGRAGANFVQNLGAALMKDKRFQRVDRGVYGLR